MLLNKTHKENISSDEPTLRSEFVSNSQSKSSSPMGRVGGGKNFFCLHCGNFTNDQFCCLGCETAYKIINEMGLSNYYESRIIDEKTRKIKPDNFEKIENIEDFIKEENGKFEIFLAVDGLHCAACVWLIESILQKQNNVILARLNLSKKYLRIVWQSQKELIKDYIKIINEIGYKLYPFDELILAEQEKKYNNDLVKCLAVAGFGAGNVMLFSSILWFSNLNLIGQATIDLMHFASAMIALPVIAYAARPFFKSAAISIKSRSFNMDVPIAVAIFLACTVSLIESFNSAKHVYFDSAVMLIFFLLIGRYLDFRARKKAFDIAKEFSILSANFARLIENDNNIKIIATKNIKKDMFLLVVAGDKIPADAIIIEGESEIDNSIITGETLPKKVINGDKVYAGAINLSLPIKIKVEKNHDQSLLSEIVKIVENAESQKNKFVKIADKIARSYTPIVHLVAFATFSLWYFFLDSGFENALLNATAVLIITCPCALALAVPIAQTITISNLIKRGILAKSGEALEKINEVEVIIFDKTGTLTAGKPKLINILGLNKNLNEEEKDFYLMLAASLAKYSSHPLSASLVASNLQNTIDLKVTEEQGFGLSSIYDHKILKLGKKDFVLILNDSIPFQFSNQAHEFKGEAEQMYFSTCASQDPQNLCASFEKWNGMTKCYFKFGDDEILFLFEDRLKSDASDVIQKLKLLNKEIILLSGDNKIIVEETAKTLGITEFYFEKTPLEKMEFLKSLNKKIMMIGDGINDAPALALSDVSVSFCKAANIAQNTADIVLWGEKLSPILDIFSITKQQFKIIKENLAIALIYNLLAVPFAIMGYVTPLIAAIAMSSSSILVLLNSLRLLKK